MDIFKSGLELSSANEWIWKFDVSGEYSVKSGYEVARIWKLSMQCDYGGVSDLTDVGLIWNRLWRSRVPDRVKTVIWTLLHNSLQVFTNIRRREAPYIRVVVFSVVLKTKMLTTYLLPASGQNVFRLLWAWKTNLGILRRHGTLMTGFGIL